MQFTKALVFRDGIRMRREQFGGILFNSADGTVVDVDREAYELLCEICEGIPVCVENAPGVLGTLLDMGFLELKSGGKEFVVQEVQSSGEDWPEYPWLTAPETVHWAITRRCDADCPDCYAKRNKWNQGELDTYQATALVELLAEIGVFQLAIGGGEPFLRLDLAEVTAAAKQNGLVTHVTTGDAKAAQSALPSLAKNLASIHLGVQVERLLVEPKREVAKLRQFVEAVQDSGLAVGVNLPLNNTVINNFERVASYLSNAGFKRVVLLRYKPPATISRWLAENPSPETMKTFEHRLRMVIQDFNHVAFRLDCALSYLQRNLPQGQALASGLRGCVAASRILALGPDGTVYPCSQLMHPRMSAGNILTEPFWRIWNEATKLRQYRSFRSKESFKQSACGNCLAKNYCGGCRVFSDDALGGDPGCPAPVKPPRHQLNVSGRRLDSVDYLEEHGSISVNRYMERYQVGQERAVKELRAAGLVPAAGDKDGKKNSVYFEQSQLIIDDIVDMIGYTSGGAPYASSEEVEAWLMDARSEETFPAWLQKSGEGDSSENY